MTYPASSLRSQLLAHLRPVLSRRVVSPQMVWGDAGVGKSHLARQVLTELGCRTQTVQASAPDAALVRLLDGSELPTWVRRVIERTGVGETVSAPALADAFAAGLGTLAPVALLVEDLHEAGPERRAFWIQVASTLGRSKGVGLLVTSRTPVPEGFAPWHLEELPPGKALALLEAEAGAALPEDAARWVLARAGGNPLFLKEYLRFLTRGGWLWSDGRTWHWRAPAGEVMPDTVEALIFRRLQSEGDEGRAVLAAGSLLTPDQCMRPGLWAALSGLPPATFGHVRARLEASGVLVCAGFAQLLFAEVTRRDLTAHERHGVAQRAIETLREQPREAAAFVVDAALLPEAAAALLLRAAEKAQAAGAEREAAHWWTARLPFLPAGEWADAALHTARAWRPHDPVRAEEQARAVFEDFRAPDNLRAEAALLRAELAWQLGRETEAEATLRALPETWRARVADRWHLALITLRVTRQDAAGALALWDAHPEVHAQASPADVYGVADSLMRLGRLDEAEALVSERLAHQDLGVSEQADLLLASVGVAFFRGDPVEALRRLEQAMTVLGEDTPDEPQTLTRLRELASSQTAYLHSVAGRYPEALSYNRASLALLERLGDGRRVARQEGSLGLTLLHLGRYDEAEDLLLRSQRELERRGDRLFLASTSVRGLVLFALETARPHGPERALRQAHSILQQARRPGGELMRGEALWLAALAEARVGDAQAALTLLDELPVPDANQGQRQWVQGLALARLGKREEAQAALQSAEALIGEQEGPLQADRCGLDLDALLGDESSARTRLARLEAAGHVHAANVARRLFPTLGHPEPPLAPATPEFRIDILGPLRLTVGGENVRLGGAKRRELLARLVEARLGGHASVSSLDLAQTLFPGEDDLETPARVQQLVYHLRRMLGPAAVQTTEDGYALGPARLDALDFLETGDGSLWRGAYLQDLGGGQDEAARGLLMDALQNAVEAGLNADPRAAARVGRLLLEAEPYSRTALAVTLRALRAAGNRKGALAVYRQARERLREVDEELPEGWAEFLAEEG
ncbi:BTAD domain-containing putative transcriptional regulator [Deinococcus alpinitundrae]|uniref:BTAD domain-containing putative transcriptional regulator n=1 Tax=Deinococcus alpinitundrae TaxID=468913 RepID=UPI0013794590|nr:BTAD domain-containing putative transcriptional regulator [Deinococcus alpinitundrae]